MRAVTHAADEVQQAGVVDDIPANEIIHSERCQNSQGQNNIQLHVDRGAAHVENPPHQNDKSIHQEDRHGRCDMRASELDEDMVQVGFVGLERGVPLEDARRHHTQRIEHRNGQHGQREGHKAEIRVVELHIFGARSTLLKGADYEYRHNDTHDKRAAVADEHFRSAAENIVEEERDQRPRSHGGQNGHRDIARQEKECAEHQTRRSAISRRKAVHAVDKVDGVDDAHRCKHRKWYGNPSGHLLQAPQTLKIVQNIITDEDQHQNDHYLYNKSQRGGQTENVVHRTDVEHRHHGHEHHRKVGAVGPYTHAANTYGHAEEYRHATQNGHRLALQFTRVGFVDNILEDRDLNDIGVNPSYDKYRN